MEQVDQDLSERIRERAHEIWVASGCGGVPSLVQIADGKALPACPACGRQMRHFTDLQIYECRECRLFVNEVRESDVNNVNTSSFEHSSRVDDCFERAGWSSSPRNGLRYY